MLEIQESYANMYNRQTHFYTHISKTPVLVFVYLTVVISPSIGMLSVALAVLTERKEILINYKEAFICYS